MNHRVLVARIYATLTDTDHATFDEAVATALNTQVGLPIHLVIDYRGIERIETEISPTRVESQSIPLTRHPKLGLRVAVAGPLLRFIPTAVESALTPPAQQYSTMDSALAYLQDADPTIAAQVQPRWRRPA